MSRLAVVFLLMMTFAGCNATYQQRRLIPPDQIGTLDESRYLKAHMRDGSVYILSAWAADTAMMQVSGDGVQLGVNRDTVARGSLTLSIDSVAIFETNQTSPSPAIAAMAVITGASVALTIYCISNPKACFGSCPTFFTDDDILQAEGFSSSIAPALETTDVDALWRARPAGRTFQLRMKNEALETHVVRQENLLAARRPPGGRVAATLEGEYWEITRIHEPVTCVGPEGDCRNLIRVFDAEERVSSADSTYLGEREHVDLRFEAPSCTHLGLLVGSRQSLMSTYLFYQTLAYMGTTASEWFAWLQRQEGDARSTASGIGTHLGRIEVLVADGDGGWSEAGYAGETGPLATNIHLVTLPDLPNGEQEIRLRMAKGVYRLDYVALVELGDPAPVERIWPAKVYANSVLDSTARAVLLDTSRVLVTAPGDEFVLVYVLPEDFESVELFLESRGYYIEWMRDEWLREEDLTRALQMFAQPEEALRRLAPQFKRAEPELETQFWNSRYAR